MLGWEIFVTPMISLRDGLELVCEKNDDNLELPATRPQSQPDDGNSCVGSEHGKRQYPSQIPLLWDFLGLAETSYLLRNCVAVSTTMMRTPKRPPQCVIAIPLTVGPLQTIDWAHIDFVNALEEGASWHFLFQVWRLLLLRCDVSDCKVWEVSMLGNF